MYTNEIMAVVISTDSYPKSAILGPKLQQVFEQIYGIIRHRQNA